MSVERTARRRLGVAGTRLVAGLAFACAAALLPSRADAGERVKRSKWDESDGFEDPHARSYPRRHRFRLGMESGYIRLSAAIDGRTGELVRFHYAPLMVNMGYQVQFARVLAARISTGFGGNVANSRTAMPLVLNPRLHLGYQGKLFAVLGTYGFMWMFPGIIDATNDRVADGINQPFLMNNHQFGGEVSFTSRTDRVAYSFAVGMVGVRSNLCHLEFDCVKRIYPMVTLGAALYFDGSIRRRKQQRRGDGVAAHVTSPALRP